MLFLFNFITTILFLIIISPLYGLETGPSSPVVPTSQPEIKKEENSGEVKLGREYFKGYLTDTAYMLTSPRCWNKWDWLTFSLVAGTAAGLYAYDKDIQTWAQDHRGETTNKLAEYFRPFGEVHYSVPALGLFYLYGYALEDSKAKKTALLGLESLVISGAFTQLIKYSTHRSRPNESEHHDTWNGPGFSDSNLSFVSGEAMNVFSLATIIASEYEKTVWVPPLAYGIATITALARINNNAHWASDVFLGSALGYFLAKTIVRLHNKKSNFEIIPIIGGKYEAIAIAWRF